MEAPTVVSILRKSDINFTFRVRAYRALTEQELLEELAVWMNGTGTKRLPHNKTVTSISIRGFDE